MKRFIKEYANYQKSVISSSELMQPEEKKKILGMIDKVLMAIEKQLITIDEAMKMIVDPFSYLNE